MNFSDYEYTKTNREKSISPTQGKHWCDYCDSYFLNKGEKCKFCGRKNGKAVLKKETNA